MSPANRIAENLAAIRAQIAAAATAAGRDPASVRLVGVTKYVGVQTALELFSAGCGDLGESRPQELWAKEEAIGNHLPIIWHLIGHLQRNKVKRTIAHAALIHSGDSPRLLEELQRESASRGYRQSILLEVNISGDATKHGFAPDALLSYAATLPTLTSLQIRGLMGMASLEGGSEEARRDFAKLRELRDALQAACPALSLPELSMGMSGDFREAIAEGATIVRIGSALFEGLSDEEMTR